MIVRVRRARVGKAKVEKARVGKVRVGKVRVGKAGIKKKLHLVSSKCHFDNKLTLAVFIAFLFRLRETYIRIYSVCHTF